MSSPLLTSNSMSPTSPKRLPFFVTTVFPIRFLENFLSSSAMLHLWNDYVGRKDVFKLYCNSVGNIRSFCTLMGCQVLVGVLVFVVCL